MDPFYLPINLETDIKRFLWLRGNQSPKTVYLKNLQKKKLGFVLDLSNLQTKEVTIVK